ncbi:hypothetical protein BT67DRAFT_455913 [Trichocladium antarcticum]|uniref:Infection structure specific protein n=1 Tax=Trichocladium antarcticum TaxID=1450529 RepID=A0AAN6UK96_9PEZI|nr:hypothetical protein BT67DRAFT_455913 [Trichocladium antarcticum]
MWRSSFAGQNTSTSHGPGQRLSDLLRQSLLSSFILLAVNAVGIHPSTPLSSPEQTMHTYTLLSALAAASLAVADFAPHPVITPGLFVSPGQAVAQALAQPQPLAPRADNRECESKVLSLASAAPTPTGTLEAWYLTVPGGVVRTSLDAGLTDLCHATPVSIPPSMSAAYASYTADVSSFHKTADPVASSLSSHCGKEVSVMAALLLATNEAQCTSAISAAASLVNSITGGNTPNVAGPRETGLAVAAAAAAAAAAIAAL